MLHRVALRIAPQNVLAGNELGVLLAQHGHLDEAESLFKQCVATDATPEAWQNLAVVYARKGDTTASRAALTAGSELASRRQSVRPVITGAASNTLMAANSADVQTLAHVETSESADTRSNADQLETGGKSLWEKLELSQKLPKVFRR
jgi:Flp pilus assembly protein TadD